MANVTPPEPQSAADYGDRTTASKRWPARSRISPASTRPMKRPKRRSLFNSAGESPEALADRVIKELEDRGRIVAL
jgi:hypothetical protein